VRRHGTCQSRPRPVASRVRSSCLLQSKRPWKVKVTLPRRRGTTRSCLSPSGPRTPIAWILPSP
jgi:hypothetical protein